MGTTNIGPIADRREMEQLRRYLQRMIDTVQIQWERSSSQSPPMPAGGSTVTVKFVMNAEGQITTIVNVESTATDPRPARA